MALGIGLIVLPMAWMGYLSLVLLKYQKGGPQRLLWGLESFRPDRYTAEGLPVLFRFWIASIVTLACVAIVIGIIQP
jgi:hypothetical protein